VTELNSNQFPEVYASLGIELSKLGVVMLDVDPFKVTEHVLQGEADLYSSQDPNKFWIQGAVAEESAHATLLYGLMLPARGYESQINVLLQDWTPPTLEIESVGSFTSPYGDEEYACIVAHLKVTPELMEGHQRLQLLPHIDTFPTYRPHVTLAYVKKEAEKKWIDSLQANIPKSLTVIGYNLGGNR
jgi:hypothetical protein